MDLRDGCGINVEHGCTLRFGGVIGDCTGCGIKQGILPPRLEGGVAKPFATPLGGMKRPSEGFVGVATWSEVVTAALTGEARGIEEGETMRRLVSHLLVGGAEALSQFGTGSSVDADWVHSLCSSKVMERRLGSSGKSKSDGGSSEVSESISG